MPQKRHPFGERMRFRSVIIYLLPLLLLPIQTASAQKRVYTSVNPNSTALNGTADMYDPLTGKMTAVSGQMNYPRERHIAARLTNGKVLIAGGYNNRYLNLAELFDPSTGTFASTKTSSKDTSHNLITARADAASVVLTGGTVLILGGYNATDTFLQSAEIFDSGTNKFSATATNMSAARTRPVATLLSDGNVLVTGGYNGSFLSSADFYFAKNRSFLNSSSTMSDSRQDHTGTLLTSGKVLIAGGCTAAETGQVYCTKYLSSADIYDPEKDTFTATNAMNTARANHTATLLLNGKVLIVGGLAADGSFVKTAEIYDPVTGKFAATGDLNTPRFRHTATLLQNGKVLIAGGYAGQALAGSEIYDPQSGTFTVVSSPMTSARSQHSATLLGDGRVMLAGGENSDLMMFDVNLTSTDNVAPNILFSADSKTGFVSYTGSGTVVSFSTATGTVLRRLKTGGRPVWMSLLPDKSTLLVVSALDNKIFVIDAASLTLTKTYSFTGTFGYGSQLTFSPDSATGYISSTDTGEVIKFEIATGKELGRLSGMGAPGQVTITKDGKTLIVVDVSLNELVFADASTMKAKFKTQPIDNKDDASASFSVFNKAVLSADEEHGVIASQDSVLLVFNVSTGEITNLIAVGASPGYTTLTASGLFWLVLCDGTFSVVPTWSHDSAFNYSVQAGALRSGNIVISPDVRYAYWASGSADRVYQQDFGLGPAVGAFKVGDEDLGVDQPSSLAFTPDYSKLAVVNFESNELDLLSDVTVMRNTKYVSEAEKFTGLSVVNLSNTPANVTFTAMTDAGAEYQTDDGDSDLTDEVQNPVTLQIPANSQKSVDVAQLFNINTNTTNSGYLSLISDQPSIAAFSEVGQIHSDFLDAYLSNVQGIPLNANYRDTMSDWIIPELPQATGTSAEYNFLNPNYNAASFDVTHYASDGTLLQKKASNAISSSTRQAKAVSDLISTIGVGQILIVGGYDSTSTKTSAELFNSSNFASTGNPPTAMQGHTATMLRNDKVLVAGGRNGSITLSSAALYDAVATSFSVTQGGMNAERYRHTATLLANGKVLIAGGQNSASINKTAELYDPSENSFVLTGAMTSPRDAHTATLLQDGRVFIAGGLDGNGTSITSEIYNPATGTFSAAANMNARRAFHTAVLLANGKVLIVGGYNGTYLNSAELYDPASGVFTPTGSMAMGRGWHTATLLADGTVLIAGGLNSTGSLASAEIYYPDTGLFLPTSSDMSSPRAFHSAALYLTLNAVADNTNTKVLIAGGANGSTTLSSADIYDPLKRTFVPASDMSTTRQGHTATMLVGGAEGYLRVTSNYGMLFTEIYNNGGADTGINGINVDRYEGVKSIYSPQFAILPDYQTHINVINANEDDATVSIILHGPDGTVLGSPLTRVLAANAQIKGNLLDLFNSNAQLAGKTGWIEVTSSLDKIVGIVSYTNPGNNFLTAYELSRAPLKNFVLPLVSEDYQYATGVALLNSGSVAANVQVELWGPSGTLDSVRSITLAPHAQTAQTLSTLFPGMHDHRSGNVRIHSDQPLHSFAALYSQDLRFITTITAVPYPGQ